jgi:GxxExxY protein
MEEYILKEECYRIIGACMGVHSELGSGFLEAVYQEALARELEDREIPFVSESRLDVYYKGDKLNKSYYADFICLDQIITELKAMEGLTDEHLAQVLNFLKATGFRIGLLINFGTSKLQYKRVIL